MDTIEQPSQKSSKKRPSLTYRQRQQAQQTAQIRRRAINEDVDLVLDHINHEAKRLSQKHKRSVEWFEHQFFQGGRVVRQKRAVTVCNAARQIDGFLEGRKGGKSYWIIQGNISHTLFVSIEITEEEKTRFTDIKAKLVKLEDANLAGQLPDEDQEFLKAKAAGWRDAKSTAPKANNRAIVQDGRLTLECIADEVCLI
jgi:hypothetical protein